MAPHIPLTALAALPQAMAMHASDYGGSISIDRKPRRTCQRPRPAHKGDDEGEQLLRRLQREARLEGGVGGEVEGAGAVGAAAVALAVLAWTRMHMHAAHAGIHTHTGRCTAGITFFISLHAPRIS